MSAAQETKLREEQDLDSSDLLRIRTYQRDIARNALTELMGCVELAASENPELLTTARRIHREATCRSVRGVCRIVREVDHVY